MKPVIFIPVVVALFCAFGRTANASEWYETLRPGITRPEILKLAGNPSRSDGNVNIYSQLKGRIQFTYESDVLRTAIYYDPPGGGVSWALYKTDGDPKFNNFGQRRAYLKAGNFSVMPDFPGRSIYTLKYPAICWNNDSGACYEVDGGYIVAEPIIQVGGGLGFFADKAARVLWIKPDGTETVLYRAADHWAALKPPGLAESEVKKRKLRLEEAGNHVLIMNVTNVLGQCDSHMGSGIDYQLYYFEDGLGVVAPSNSNGTFAGMCIVKPGLTNLTFSEWLDSAQPGAPTNSPSPVR